MKLDKRPPRSEILAAVLDIDDTISKGNSWTTLTAALGVSVSAHLDLYSHLLAGALDEPGASAALVDLWRSSGKATRSNLADILSHISFYDDALGLADWLRRREIDIWLISGSMDLYVKAVAEVLQAQRWQANSRLIFDDRGTLCRLEYRPRQDLVKREQLLGLCREHGINPSQTVAIGDGANDTELFKLTGRGILVDRTGSPRPHRISAWRVVSTLREIPELLAPELARRCG